MSISSVSMCKLPKQKRLANETGNLKQQTPHEESAELS